MARTAILAAGVLSLILVGKAQADETVTSADTSQGVIGLLGKTFCLSQSPPDTQCDWRMPALKAAEPANTGSAFSLFGKWYCIGATPVGHCDFQFPPDTAAPEPKSKTFRFLGVNLCFGDVSPSSKCDLRFPATPGGSDRRASL